MNFKNATHINRWKGKQWLCLLFLVTCFNFSGYGQCSMSCVDEIQVSLNQECEAEITYRMILRDPDNPFVCNPNGPQAYVIVVMDEEGVEIPTSPVVTCDYIGRTLLVKAKHWFSGNSCWSRIVIEDKQPPIVSCENVELWCNQDIRPSTEGGDVPAPVLQSTCEEDCGSLTFNFVDEQFVNECDSEAFRQGKAATIIRRWEVCDQNGNCSICEQIINLLVPNISNIQLPPDFIGENALSCTDNFNLNDFSLTGMPSLHNLGFTSEFCQISVSNEDKRVAICGGAFRIERTWTIVNLCTEETLTHLQVIELLDNLPPVINCNVPSRIVGTPVRQPFSCLATITVPNAIITDNCSVESEIDVITKIYRVYPETGEREVVSRVEGTNGGYDLDLPFGFYEVFYQATDPCGNVINNLDNGCKFELVDETPPTPVCNASTKLTLDREGRGLIFARSFDNGSFDNCCLDIFEVRRMDDETGEFNEYVEFACEDTRSTEPLLVQLRLTDCFGNSSICMVEVIIDDKTGPTIISCAENVVASCSDGLSIEEIRTTLLSPPVAEDDCIGGIRSEVVLKQDFRNECGIGAVIFEWRVFDAAGNGPSTCEQLVAFEDNTPINVEFPPDFVAITCITSTDELPPSKTGMPVISGMDCETVEVLFTDSPLKNDISCGYFTRTWVVTNLCDINGTSEHVQMITIRDVDPPIIDCDGEIFDICLDGDECARSIEIPGITVTDCSASINVRAEWTFTPHVACTGMVETGRVENAGNGFNTPVFGPGQLVINFFATDACENEAICSRIYNFRDCQAPEILCLPGITLNLDASGMVEVWANDFHQEIIDNCDDCPNLAYQFSFTQDTSEVVRFFGCDDLGVRSTQVWITDPFGNQNFCPVTFVLKSAGNCGDIEEDDTTVPPVLGGMSGIMGKVLQETGAPVEAVEVSAENHLAEMMDRTMTNEAGGYAFEFSRNSNVQINPYKNDDVINGVTTFDILQLRQHILGAKELDSPYRIIAADVNHSNSVTTADIVALRRVILQFDEEFPNNTSWRFIKADHQFSNPLNPFEGEMPESATIPDLTEEMEIDFIAIKVGDLNGNAVGRAALGVQATSRNTPPVNFEIIEKQISKNSIETIQFKLSTKDIEALQLTLNFDPRLVEIIDIPKTNLVNETNFGTRFLTTGALTLSWDKALSNTIEFFTFELKVKTNQPTVVSELFTINSTITPAVAYDAIGVAYPIGLAIVDDKYDYTLFQNQPNPFQTSTNIRFSLPAKSQGKLTILDINGRTLKTFEQVFEKGINEIPLTDLPAKGVLYYQLETSFGTKIKKMLRVE